MFRKFVAICFVVVFLVACGKKEEPEVSIPEGFKGPTSGPNLSDLQPTYGPNDPVSE